MREFWNPKAEKEEKADKEKVHIKEVMLRIFYWSAYVGHYNIIKDYMIMTLKWSPFIPAYKGKCVFQGAIEGRQLSLVKYMCQLTFKRERHDGLGLVNVQEFNTFL